MRASSVSATTERLDAAELRDAVDFGRMLPPALALAGGASREPLQCLEPVRILPRRRLVCRARWRGQPVYAKVFVDARRARADWTRERDGAAALQQAGVAAPAVLHSGPLALAGAFVVIYQSLDPAISFRARWTQADAQQRQALLGDIASILAQLHAAGLTQTDVHLDNFLLVDGRVYTLDAGAVHVAAAALGPAASWRNLVEFIALLGPYDASLVDAVVSNYCRARGWPRESAPLQHLQRAVARRRGVKERRYLRKVLRSSSAHVAERRWGLRSVHLRIQTGADIQAFVADPDRFVNAPDAKILKRGNSSTVVQTRIDAQTVVIKRYNLKGLWHALRRMPRTTRAAISWVNAHRLAMYGIATAPPVALVEYRFGPLARRAYLMMEYISGVNCVDYFAPGRRSAAERLDTARRIAGMLSGLARRRISHGDMKASNLVIAPTGPVLLDLDAMRQHHSRHRFETAFRDDLQRFMRNWPPGSETAALFEQALRDAGLQSYLPSS